MTSVEQTVVGETRDCSVADSDSHYFRRKTIFEQAAAAMMLVPGLPAIGILILTVRATSRGPGIFRQKRVGRGGRPFVMYKIRTMRIDAEAGKGAMWARNDDPRTTWLGKVLRKLHLDELPQLFNVLKGEMSLIGPRPERPEFVTVLADHIPGYTDRLAVLPGVTGLAQINLPPDTDLDSVRRKQKLDLEYIETAGAWLDVRILLCTFLRLVGIKGLLPARLMGLRRNVGLPGVPHSEPVASNGEATPDGVARQAVRTNGNGHSNGRHVGNGAKSNDGLKSGHPR